MEISHTKTLTGLLICDTHRINDKHRGLRIQAVLVEVPKKGQDRGTVAKGFKFHCDFSLMSKT